MLEWGAISLSRGRDSSWPRDQACLSCTDRQALYREQPGKPGCLCSNIRENSSTGQSERPVHKRKELQTEGSSPFTDPTGWGNREGRGLEMETWVRGRSILAKALGKEASAWEQPRSLQDIAWKELSLWSGRGRGTWVLAGHSFWNTAMYQVWSAQGRFPPQGPPGKALSSLPIT